MTVPANLNAAWYGRNVGHAVVSISTPLNGSNIVGNSTSEAISGVASSNGGNINSVQYQIDSGSWQTITITPAATVNYSGGNAGGQGVGNHTVTVKVTDTASNTAQVSSSYSISSGSVTPSYSWGPQFVYNGQTTNLVISNSSHNAAVTINYNQYDAHGSVVLSGSNVSIGTTDSNGNLSYSTTTAWATNAWTDNVALFVAGTNVANFNFSNYSGSPNNSITPSVSPSGNVTLSMSGEYANSTVSQTITYFPSNRTSGPTAIGSTNSAGNFSAGISLSWGSDTSASIVIALNGITRTSATITP